MSFADAPISLNEVRAERERDGKLWAPRDALVNLLRDIDTGQVNPTDMVVAYRVDTENGGHATRFVCAGPGALHVSLGMMARVSFMMQEKDG